MNKSVLFAVVCALSSVACDLKCFGECDEWDEDCSDEPHDAAGGRSQGPKPGHNAYGGTGATGNGSGGRANSGGSGDSGGSSDSAGANSAGTNSAGTNSAGANSAGSGNAGKSGGTANSGGSGGTANSAGKGGSGPVSCAEERDCPRGFNCDYERKQCVPADAETCPELSTESACDNRKDCMSVYAGLNCSCGANCECVGGEPGCICQSFEFFTCEVIKK